MDQNSQKQVQASQGFNLGKFLKLIFLGNGKYWPTTLYLWNIILFLIFGYFHNLGYTYSFVVGGGMVTGIILIILAIPFYFPPIFNLLDKYGLIERAGSGFVGFQAPNILVVIITWLIIISLLNYLIVKAIEKHKSKKNPNS